MKDIDPTKAIEAALRIGFAEGQDQVKEEIEKLRAALQWLLNDLEDYPASARPLAAYDNARTALGEKE